MGGYYLSRFIDDMYYDISNNIIIQGTRSMITINQELKALAEAVLKEDVTAACAMWDWLLENTTKYTGRYSVAYVEKLEDALRTISALVTQLDFVITQKEFFDLDEETHNKLHILCKTMYSVIFGVERLAKSASVKRSW